MKKVLITGATGMIGNVVLQACLERDDVVKVTSVSRKSLGIKHEKLVEILHDDFLNFSNIQDHFKNQDICFFCIGVYTGAVPNDTFKKITVDFTRSFAEALKKNSSPVTFCFLSGQGADSTEKSRILFAREKGVAENILKSLNFDRLHIFRPGYIYPSTPRKEPNLMYRVMRVLYKPVSKIYPNIGLTSVKLGTKMVEVGFGNFEQVVFENIDIRK